MAEELQLKIQADISDLQVEYKNIEKLEEERAAKAKILTQQTLALRKKALKEEEAALQSMIAQQEKAGASNREQFQKPIEESTQKIQSLQREITGLGPPMAAATEGTKKLTFGQQQLNRAVKTVQSTLRGFAITAALAFGAAAIKALKEYAQELLHVASAEEKLAEARRKAIPQIAEERAKIATLVATAKDLTLSLESRQYAITALNKISPEYLGNLTLETIGTEEATAAINKYIEAIKNKATEQALEQQLIAANVKELEAEADQNLKVSKTQIPLLQGIVLLTQAKKIERKATADLRAENAKLEQQAISEAITRLRLANAVFDAERLFAEQQAEADKKGDDIVKARREREKAAADALAERIQANKEQAAAAIQGLQDEIAKAEAEQIEDEFDRARALAVIELDIAKRNAEKTIDNREQLHTALELLETQHKNRIAEIQKQEDEEAAAEERLRIIEGRKTLHKALRELEDQERERIIEARRTKFEAEKELEERAAKEQQERFEARIDTINALGDSFRALAQIVGEETEKGAKLSKAAAIFDILSAQAVSIANAVQAASSAAKSSSVAAPAVFVATLATMLAVTLSNIAKAKAIIDGAKLPGLAEGRSDGPGTMAVVGERGQEIVYIPKGAAVFNNQATRNEREMIEALNDGKIHDYLNKNFIYPAIIAAQAAQKQQDRQQMKELVETYLDNTFDDKGLREDNRKHRELLKLIAARVKPKPTPAFRSRFG